MTKNLPVAIIGAGPVGLAAAAHLLRRGLTPLVLERGTSVGSALLDWGHIRAFSPWKYNIDAEARALLEEAGWAEPEADVLPTGGEIVRHYLAPLAGHPAIAPHLRLQAEVIRIARAGLDKVSTSDRAAAPFTIRWRDARGEEHATLARAVIDTSGIWGQPNPMGIDGLPVDGEAAASARIAYGLPDVLGAARADYAGQRVLLVGGGHSAVNIALDLMKLRADAPATRVQWALRRDRIDRLLGGGLNDKLPARGALGQAARQAIDEKRLEILAPFAAERITRTGDELTVDARLGGQQCTITVDRIIVATGFRPRLDMLRELRIGLDPALEAPVALAPSIDPNLHSCGTVPPHGARELAHPEPGFYIAGSKSYGRAPTFLMVTGYEQVRSIAAEIAGDHEAARDVRLVLPETGVCITDPVAVPVEGLEAGASSGGCCGGPAPDDVDACCVADAEAKSAGDEGCGCGSGASSGAPSSHAVAPSG